MLILFLHGWHSVLGGVKPTYLQDHGHEVLNHVLDDDDLRLAVRPPLAEFDQYQFRVIVASSRGWGRCHEPQERYGEARPTLPGVEESRNGQDS